MVVFIERHIQGYCLVNRDTLFSLADGKPHMRSTMYFKTRALATKYATDNNMEIEVTT